MITKVNPGDNLASIISSSLMNDELVLDSNFVGTVPGLIIDKPLTIRGAVDYGNGRIIPTVKRV